MHPPGFEPMLASTGHGFGDRGWSFEPKLDGWRAVVHARDADLRVYSRPGRDISASVPVLADLVEVLPPGTVLDGELVAGSGRAASFYGLGSLLATRPEHRHADVVFVAFDVLALEGRVVMGEPYRERRRLLEGLGVRGSAWCTVSSWTDVAAGDLLAACEQLDVEGLVAKREVSRYRPGQRSADWVKVKTPSWRSIHGPNRHKQPAVVIGATESSGDYGTGT